MKEMIQIREQADQLYSMCEIEQVLERLAKKITQDYADKNPVLLCVMNGSVMTTGHLMPKLNFPLELDYIHATRYGEKTVGGEIVWQSEPMIDLSGRAVILIEDIYDQGVTLVALREFCEAAGASSVVCLTLVEKLHDKKVGQRPEYIGMTVPDRYVFGFGMDYKGYWRNAPGIYAVAGL
jgi:hypoxanthine phosphoribosyltransferase